MWKKKQILCFLIRMSARMVLGGKAYFQEGMRIIYSFYFCMYKSLVLINERVDVGKRSNFSIF